MVDPNTPGGRLHAARTEAGMTQVDLEAHSGISRAHIAHLETNTYRGGRNAWEAIAGALNRPLDYFLGNVACSELGGEADPYRAKDANEVALLDLWRDLSDRGRRAFADALFNVPVSDEDDISAIRLAREGDNIIIAQEFSPRRAPTAEVNACGREACSFLKKRTKKLSHVGVRGAAPLN